MDRSQRLPGKLSAAIAALVPYLRNRSTSAGYDEDGVQRRRSGDISPTGLATKTDL